MTCTHSRTLSAYLKHDDRTDIKIPHLNYHKNSTYPSGGIFRGDDTQFTVCMTCGQIMNWELIEDSDFVDSDPELE
jgi:hypothetical protein